MIERILAATFDRTVCGLSAAQWTVTAFADAALAAGRTLSRVDLTAITAGT